MTRPFTIAHFSDVHLAPIEGFTLPYWNIKRTLGYLNWLRGRVRVHQRRVADMIAADVREQAPQHIAVSGDLVNLGLPSEYRAARAWLDRLGEPHRVSVVPGNHDIYTGQLYGASCLEDWAPFMTPIGNGSATISRSDGFPFVRRLNGVALIGVNSAIPTPPFVAAGRVGAEQLSALGAILEEARREGLARVVMIHHPPLPGQAPPRRALADAPALKTVLEQQGADLVLHGHNHTDTTVWLMSSRGAVPVCGIPSASASAAHKVEPLARYALYTFEAAADGTAKPLIHRVTRGLAEPNGSVRELERRVMSPDA